MGDDRRGRRAVRHRIAEQLARRFFDLEPFLQAVGAGADGRGDLPRARRARRERHTHHDAAHARLDLPFASPSGRPARDRRGDHFTSAPFANGPPNTLAAAELDRHEQLGRPRHAITERLCSRPQS